MSSYLLPFWAGGVLLFENSQQSAAIAMLQAALILFALGLLARGVLAASLAGARTRRLDLACARQLAAYGGHAVLGRVLVAAPGSGELAAVGILRPRLVLDFDLLGALSPEEAVAVLAHERAHVRRRDALRMLAAGAAAGLGIAVLAVCLALYSAVLVGDFEMTAPAACAVALVAAVLGLLGGAAAERAMAARGEAQADRSACAAAGGPALASALIALARGSRHRRRDAASVGALGSAPLARRIRQALDYRKDRPDGGRLAALAALLIMAWAVADTSAAVERIRVGRVQPGCFSCCRIAKAIDAGTLVSAATATGGRGLCGANPRLAVS